MKKIVLSLVMALTAVSLHAQIDRTSMPAAGPAPSINLEEPTRFELKNGLTVMVVENHKLPRVSIQLSIDNPPALEGDKAGVSSLAAGLMGNGSTSISKDDFNEEVDFLGANISFGSSSAFASSLSKYFPRVLELMADAAIHPNFTEEEFQKEKERTLAGLKSQEKDVAAMASRVQAAIAYGTEHPYGEFATEETVNNVTLADAKAYYDTYFNPNSAYLVIIGDVNTKEVKKLVKKHFSSWEKGAPIVANWENPSPAKGASVNFIDMPNAVQSEVSVQNIVNLQMKDPDYLSTLMANRILGGGGSARLFQNLREDKAYTYGSYSSIGNSKYSPSRFRAYASVRNAVTDSAAVQILEEVQKIISEPVTQKELDAAKATYVGSFVMALEQPSTIARYALNIETEGLPKDFYKTYLERVNAITVADVQAAAGKYFTTDNTQVVVTGKGQDVLENLEKMTFQGKSLPVKYYNTNAEQTDKPEYKMPIPEGVTAATVIESYLDALGGREALEKVESVAIYAAGEVQGMTLNFKIIRTTKDQFMQDVSMMGNSMSKQVFNGESGYMAMQGQKIDFDEKQTAMIKDEAQPFYELGLSKDAISLEGIEKVDGESAYKVKVSPSRTAFYSVTTGQKIREVTVVEMMGQSIESTMNFGDYKEASGILFPFTIGQMMGPQLIEFKVEKVEVNSGVSDADFN
ncbi:insulinase family protein [Flavobacteriaceae bacterium LSUCC0859]|jgi:predicted Zn-dependent peptidase|nr:insulinase family protein [Flavobacteriaceae bacterium LSUCC0859]